MCGPVTGAGVNVDNSCSTVVRVRHVARVPYMAFVFGVLVAWNSTQTTITQSIVHRSCGAALFKIVAFSYTYAYLQL